ncbi:MAG: aminotransferase class I/II-fold pyridoxal phosphate-dependent enzyme [Alphaproteobacteria bacterium]|nr:aminotransferase class I/II-fold pyridoxal phosphate-dependent enzyme [Alphaproteobacteria bacterium]
MTREALLSGVGPRTRGLLLCSPANPTGKVLTAAEPQGGFLLLADCSNIRALATDDPAMALLERCGVAAVGGEAFSTRASDWHRLRFCVAKSEATLEEACRRLATL